MSGPSRTFPQPYESSENQGRWPNAGNAAYSAGGQPPPQQMSNPGGYSHQPPALSAASSYPPQGPGFPSLPVGFSYSGPSPPSVQSNASMSIPGYPYNTQSASYHQNYAPGPNASYAPSHSQTPSHSQMTEGVQAAPGGYYQEEPDSDEEYIGQDLEGRSSGFFEQVTAEETLRRETVPSPTTPSSRSSSLQVMSKVLPTSGYRTLSRVLQRGSLAQVGSSASTSTSAGSRPALVVSWCC